MIAEAFMQSGTRPEDGEEKQSQAQITVSMPPSMAGEIRRRVKLRRAADPDFSRNDFVRAVFREYFDRHPVKP